MDSGLRSTLIGAAISVVVALGGSWLVINTNQARLLTRVEAVESAVNIIRPDTTEVIGLKKDVQYLGSKVNTQDINVSDVSRKVESLQITSAKSVDAINRLSDAVERFSKTTDELAKIVARLDERVGMMEKRRL